MLLVYVNSSKDIPDEDAMVLTNFSFLSLIKYN